VPLANLNRWLGVFALLFCGATLFLWIPFDVDTGMVEKVRRQIRLGDAFAPTIAALLIRLGGLLVLLQRPTKPLPDKSEAPLRSPDSSQLATANRLLQPKDLAFSLYIILLVTIALMLMRYAGPMLLLLLEGPDMQYRLLRDTAPWKYIGFVVGGMFMVTSLIAFSEKRLRFSHFLTAVFVVLLLIAVYDLPFDDLLLPPNGDV